MTRRPFADLEDDLVKLEDRMGTEAPELPIAPGRGTSFAEQAEDARDVLTDEECTRLADPLEDLEAETNAEIEEYLVVHRDPRTGG